MASLPSILVAAGRGRAVRVKLVERSGAVGVDIRAMTSVAPATPEALSPTADGLWVPLSAAIELARAIGTVAGRVSILAEAETEGRGPTGGSA